MTKQDYTRTLFEAYNNCTQVANDLFSDITLAEAYDVAAGVTTLRGDNQESPTGYKLSATNDGSQKTFGVSEPIWGLVTQPPLTSPLVLKEGQTPLVELEIVFIAQQDIDAQVTDEQLLAGFQVAVGLEFPMPRYAGFPKITGGQFVADNVAAWNVTYGPAKQLSHKDLENIKGILYFDGEQVGENTSVCVLQHPVNALRWLVNELAKNGQSIKKGQFIFSGTFTPPSPAKKGTYKGEIDGIGTVEFTVH